MRRNGHPRPSATERIRRRTSSSVAHAAARGPAAVHRRLRMLDREWTIERTAQTLWGAGALLGLWLDRPRRRGWRALSAVAAAFLAQESLGDSSPLRPLLRRLGFRTLAEIAVEREALVGAGAR